MITDMLQNLADRRFALSPNLILIACKLVRQLRLILHVNTEDTYQLKMHTRMRTDNVMLVKSLCLQGHCIARILALDAEQELKTGELMTVLPLWKLPEYILYAVVLKRTEQPSKIIRCLEILKTFFLQKKSS